VLVKTIDSLSETTAYGIQELEKKETLLNNNNNNCCVTFLTKFESSFLSISESVVKL